MYLRTRKSLNNTQTEAVKKSYEKTLLGIIPGSLPLFTTDFLDISDPVLAFDKIMEEIEIEKYLKPEPTKNSKMI